MACKYTIDGVEYTESELKDYLIKGGLEKLVKDNVLDLSKIKPIEDAVQEPSASSVLQSEQKEAGEAGRERGGVEQGKQGQKIAEEGKQAEGDEKVNEFLYSGSDKQRRLGLLNNLLGAANIPEAYKEGLKSKGLNYEVSNQSEAAETAKGIVESLGVNDALQIARSSMIDPSVGSAVFAESINKLWAGERKLRNQGETEEANALAEQWADTAIEYANLSNSKGKWNAQIAYFYNNSPLGFVRSLEKQDQERFNEFYSSKEKDYKQAFDELLQTQEGAAFFEAEVESKLKEERKAVRSQRDKNIDEFFEKLKAKSNVNYAVPIPPPVWNGAVDIMKTAVKGGDRVVVAVEKAIKHIDEQLKGVKWDKEKFRKEYTDNLTKVADGGKTEGDLLQTKIKTLEAKVKEYEKRIAEGGAVSKKTEDKFADNEEVKSIKSKIEQLRKENDDLLKQKQEGRYSKEAKTTLAEKRALKSIEELEKKLEENDLETTKAEAISSPKLNELRAKKKKLSEELEERKKTAGVGRYSEEAMADAAIKRKKEKIKEYERRLAEGDFSSEKYKAKKEKDVLDEELDAAREAYQEARKTSEEFVEKKAKQYLDRLGKRLKGMSADQKNQLIRGSIKKIAETGGLEYEDFKKIVAETLGVKELTEAQKQKIEELTEKTNIPDDLEQEFLNNPTREGIDNYKKAKANSLQAEKELFEMTSDKADITGTVRSIMTLNLLGAPTLIKNYGQNVIYQATVRFPSFAAIKVADAVIYGTSAIANKVLGTKVIKPGVSFTKAQQGYIKEYKEGLIRGYDQMIKGVEEKDYFSKTQYASNLNPRKALRDLLAARRGEIFLTKGQKIDKFIQATAGWQPYAIARGMMFGDKPPRYAAQGAEAMQIGYVELGISDPIQLEAFMTAPEKYALNHLLKTGKSREEAAKIAEGIKNRIIEAGSRATFQNENMINDLIKKVDEWGTVGEKDPMAAKMLKPAVSLLKATQLPFVKTPANVIWAYIKVANPEATLLKSFTEYGLAKNALAKGDIVNYKRYQSASKESFGFAVTGFAISAAVMSLIDKDMIKPRYSREKDKAKESAGEAFFGKDNMVNLGKMLGTSDRWVDLSWFGPVGSIMDQKARIAEDHKEMILKGEEIPTGYISGLLENMDASVTASLNTLLLDQGAKLIDGIRKGGSLGAGLGENIFTSLSGLNPIGGGTLASLSKALLPEKTTTKADNMVDQLINNQKQRNIFIAWAAGYPPSKVSIWGEPIKNDRSVGGVISNMLGVESGNEDKFGAVLYDDQQRTADNRFFPPLEDKKIKVNDKDVELTLEQKNALDTYIGQARKALVAPFVYDQLSFEILEKGAYVSRYYSNLDDERKIEALDVLYTQGKEAGFSKFKEDFPQFQDAALDVEKIKREALKSVEKTIFETKVKYPKNN
jgi:hypothetical protein